MLEKVKKKWYQKWWVWVLIVLAIGIIGSNMNNDEAKPVTANNVEKTEKQDSSESKEKEPEPKSKEENRTITKPGEGIQTKNFKISVESFSKPESDNMFIKPEEGNEFVSVGILIENISEKDYTVSSIIMFDAYQDGFSMNEAITAHAIKGYEKTLDGALAAGKKLKGNLIYEVPKDWKELEIDVDLTKLSFSTDGEVKIHLNNN